MTRGKFLTIEGQDGAGKSTNIAVMRDYLESQHIEFIQTREPGGTQFGEKVRELILNSGDELIGNKAELLLMFAARAQHIETIIEPALHSGKWVLCDRFTDASYAYQGAGRGIDTKDIELLEKYTQQGLTPDLTLVLDLPTEVGESRAGGRSAPDRFEQQKLDFKQRVRDCYLQRARKDPTRMKVVDASQTLEIVKASVMAQMQEFGARV